MENVVLSIEQMHELEELGIDTSNATMLWTAIVDADYNPIDWIPVVRRNKNSIEELRREFPLTYKEGNVYYAYTLQDILEMLPKEFTERTDIVFCENRYTLNVFHLSSIWRITYWNDGWGDFKSKWFESDSLLEATFNMLKWCKENKYI